MPPDGRDNRSWVEATLDRIQTFLTRDLWSAELRHLPTLRAWIVKTFRVVYLAVRGFVEDNCLFRASALTYITILSLVPLLAFAFSVAKGLGAYDALLHETIEPFLDETFGAIARDGNGGEVGADASSSEPGAAQPGAAVVGPEASEAGAEQLRLAIDEVLKFVQNTNVGSLGLVGLMILVYAVIKLLSSVERSFNDIWGVRQARTLARKVADYLSMVIIVPLFLVAAAGLSAVTQTDALLESFGSKLKLDEFGLRLSSIVALWIGFTLVYVLMPNTRTRFGSAALGGIVGGSMWYVAQILHVRFQVGVANYNAIYSGFAAFPIFMLWIYVSWVTVLFGAEFASASQNQRNYRQIALARQFDHGFKEVLALRAVVRIAAAFLQGRDPYQLEQLSTALGVPERTVQEVVDKLEENRVLAVTDDLPQGGILPARDVDKITIKLVLDAMKGTVGPVHVPPSVSTDRQIDETLADYEQAIEGLPLNRSMRELAVSFLADERRGSTERLPSSKDVSG